jgi:hypothetical protein
MTPSGPASTGSTGGTNERIVVHAPGLRACACGHGRRQLLRDRERGPRQQRVVGLLGNHHRLRHDGLAVSGRQTNTQVADDRLIGAVRHLGLGVDVAVLGRTRQRVAQADALGVPLGHHGIEPTQGLLQILRLEVEHIRRQADLGECGLNELALAVSHGSPLLCRLGRLAKSLGSRRTLGADLPHLLARAFGNALALGCDVGVQAGF